MTKEELNKLLTELKDSLELTRKYYHALTIINFDFETIAPEKARKDQSDVMDYFLNEAFKIRNTERNKELVVLLHENIDLLDDPLDKSLIDKLYDAYLTEKNVTPELNLKKSQVHSKAYINWLKAKEESNYSLFKESLKDIIEVEEEVTNLRENKLPDLYDTYLNDYEKGVLQKDLDPFFSELKAGLIELIDKIKNSKHVIRTDFLNRKVPIYKQEEFSKYLLELNGFDFSKGALTTTEHPFTSCIARYDSRVTTHYYEDMFLSNVFSVIHEGGHAIFMQNERGEDHDHFINDYVSNGMHESVSRFYENVLGRSREYIHLIYPKFKELFSEEFPDVSEEELYEGVNVVTPSLIRTEADEVTYGLHIIIRYEMEKLITSKKISLDDIPAKWNQLYKDYLGVDVPSDKEGVLQDVHWTGGFGYFPSYALGNAYNAMYTNRMEEEIGLFSLVKKGDFETIKKWMTEHVFAHANVLDPKDWLKELTEQELSPKPFLEYLNKKYSKIYRF